MVVRGLVLAFAALLLFAGVLWTGLGLGWWGDDGHDTLATVGPLVAGLAVALAIVTLKPRR